MPISGSGPGLTADTRTCGYKGTRCGQLNAKLEREVCQGCWTCLERCQMEALIEEGDRVALVHRRQCSAGAGGHAQPTTYAAVSVQRDTVTFDATLRAISQARAEMR